MKDPWRFTNDLLGKKGGDMFDFTVEDIVVSPDSFDGKLCTSVFMRGVFTPPEWVSKEDFLSTLMGEICGYVESYTDKHPQDCSIYLT